MKYLLVYLIVIPICLSAQSRFSKHMDIAGQASSDYVLSSVMQNDTLYFTSFHPCFLEGNDWYECASIGMMNSEGQLLKERKIDWLKITGFYYKPMVIQDDYLIIAGGASRIERNVSLSLVDRYTLDSIQTAHYVISPDYDLIYASGVVVTPSYYVMSGWAYDQDADVWPDWMLWIDRASLELIHTTEYPYQKTSVIPHQIHHEQDTVIMYYSGFDTRPNIDSSGYYDSRGFLRYEPQEDGAPEVTFIYHDTLDNSISGHWYLFNSLLLSNGNMVYRQNYRDPPDNNIINGSEYELLCIDSKGEMVWRSHDIGFNRYGEKELLSLMETEDGHIIGAGKTEWGFELETHYAYEFDWFNPIDTVQTIHESLDSIGVYQAPYFAKFDMYTGELIWEYAFIDFTEEDFSGPSAAYDVHVLSDGSLMGAGRYIYRADHPLSILDYDSWFFRLPSDVCLSGRYECTLDELISGTHDGVWVDISNDKPYNIYPNPASNVMTIEAKDGQEDQVQIEMYGIGAQLLYSCSYQLGSPMLIPDHIGQGKLLVVIKDQQGQYLSSDLLIVHR